MHHVQYTIQVNTPFFDSKKQILRSIHKRMHVTMKFADMGAAINAAVVKACDYKDVTLTRGDRVLYDLR